MSADERRRSSGVPRASEKPEILRVLAANVRGLRDAFGWSQQEMSERSGVARGSIKHIESGRGNPGASTLFRLANGFGVTFTDLVDSRLPPRPLSRRLAIVRYPDPDALSVTLGARVTACRRRRGLSRVKLANLAGVSRSGLSAFERGRMEPSLTFLDQLARTMKMHVAELVEGQDSPLLSSQSRRKVLRSLQAFGKAELVSDKGSGVSISCTELALAPTQRVNFDPDEPGSRAVVYVFEGNVRLIGPAGEHKISAEDAVVIAADVPIAIANRGDTPARVLHVGAAPWRWQDVDDDVDES